MRIGPTEIIIVIIIVGFICLCVLGVILYTVVLSEIRRSKSPSPGNSITPLAENSAQSRLLELNDLLKNSLISQDEYEAKKAEIIKQI